MDKSPPQSPQEKRKELVSNKELHSIQQRVHQSTLEQPTKKLRKCPPPLTIFNIPPPSPSFYSDSSAAEPPIGLALETSPDQPEDQLDFKKIIESLKGVQEDKHKIARRYRRCWSPARMPMTFLGTFTLGAQLADGRFGPIFFARDMSRKYNAVLKFYLKSKLKKSQLQLPETISSEIDTQFSLRHKNVLGLYGYCEDSRFVCAIVEYAPIGTMYDLLLILPCKRMHEKNAAFNIRGLARGLVYLHALDVFDRDLRPTSILIGIDGQPKIADFGYEHNDFLMSKGYCGLVDYVSPEHYYNVKNILPSVDLWRLGVLCFELVVGRAPFDSHVSADTPLRRMLGAKYSVPSFVSGPAKDIMSKLLVAKRELRIGLSTLLAHPWICDAPKKVF